MAQDATKKGDIPTEIVPAIPENQATVSVEKVILAALEKGVPIDVMERVFALREKLKDEFAKAQFHKDMALAQSDMPVIEKTKEGGKTKSGHVAYKYAELGEIAKAVQPHIHKHGFSYSIRAEVNEKGVKATCIVYHKFGHSEESSVEFPLTTKTEIMSAPQVVAATMTFAKRYAFVNAFGIMTAEEDKEDWLQDRVERVEEFAFSKIKETIEKLTGKDLEERVKFLEEEMKLATALEAGTSKVVPKLGLKASQYQSLLAIAKARVAGQNKPADPGRDDAGFVAAQNG